MEKIMKAVVIDSFGPAENMSLREIPVPLPKSNQMLVRVFAAGINPVDTYIRAGRRMKVSGAKFPKVMGRDLAGEVESAGSAVKNFKPGDRVMGTVNPKSGGSYAEFAVVDESRACIVPSGMSFSEAAGVPVAGVTAMQSFEKAGLPIENKSILIIGASGGVGTFALQIARDMGAAVTAVCSSKNSGLVRTLGAVDVMEYDKTDYLKPGRTFDFVFDYAGGGDMDLLRGLLNPKGKYITIVGRPGLFMMGLFEPKYKWFLADINAKYLNRLKEMAEAGKVKTVIDRILPLENAVEAHKYVETKRAAGKVILQVR